MSETLVMTDEIQTVFAEDFAAKLTDRLDQVLPFEPMTGHYQPTALDLALISEEVIGARTRWKHLWDSIDQDKPEGGKLGKIFYSEKFYDEHYPDDNREDDMHLLADQKYVPQGIVVTPALLAKYGSNEAAVADSYDELHVPISERKWCHEQRITQAKAERYFTAARSFKDQLYEIGFIGEDEFLKQPLRSLGTAMAGALFDGEMLEHAVNLWDVYLEAEVGEVNFVGENPDVMEDTIEFLLEWTHDCFAFYKDHQEFPDQSAIHYDAIRPYDYLDDDFDEDEDQPRLNIDGQLSLLEEQT